MSKNVTRFDPAFIVCQDLNIGGIDTRIVSIVSVQEVLKHKVLAIYNWSKWKKGIIGVVQKDITM